MGKCSKKPLQSRSVGGVRVSGGKQANKNFLFGKQRDHVDKSADNADNHVGTQKATMSTSASHEMVKSARTEWIIHVAKWNQESTKQKGTKPVQKHDPT